MTVHTERFGTRHRAALGITEQTDAVVIVVSEENSQISVVERARIVRNLSEAQLAKAIRTLLAPDRDRNRLGRRLVGGTPGGRAPRLADLGRFVPTRVARNGRDHGDGAPRSDGPPRAPTISDDEAAAARTPR
jgi:DisA bacterial checkpoint controller nucleotide-binding